MQYPGSSTRELATAASSYRPDSRNGLSDSLPEGAAMGSFRQLGGSRGIHNPHDASRWRELYQAIFEALGLTDPSLSGMFKNMAWSRRHGLQR